MDTVANTMYDCKLGHGQQYRVDNSSILVHYSCLMWEYML